MERSRFDVVIVGGGPAGAVAANRLSADADRTVLLLEAGPDYGGDVANWPADLLYSQQQPRTSHSWNLEDAGSGIFLPRARVLGGASAVNACYWIRGSARDFDDWAAFGNPGWSFDDLLPYFNKAESDPLGGPMHGTDGPVPVLRADEYSPGDAAFSEACVSQGMVRVDDINGAREQVPSVGPVPKNIASDNRVNAVLSYLAPVRGRANLTIRCDTLVDRVRFEGERAVGVVTSTGEEIDAGTVVLAAGAYFTPGILNRSGYGSEADLNALGIPVRQALPGVGQNLLDHPFSIEVLGGTLIPEAEYGKQLQGQAMARSRGTTSIDEIDCHIYNAQGYDPDLERWTLSISVSLVNARSTGTVSLTSTDPNTAPRIEHRHYHDTSDLERMLDGVEMASAIYHSAPLTDIVEDLPDRYWSWSDRDSLAELVRARSQTTNHCSGTTKMGPSSDPLAVVDTAGRVYGAENLVVADSSIFPTCPRGNIHFPVVAAAEKVVASLL
ncbi:MAG TPA: GMC family oxidoreductase N-terminal domain-containing protein [Acidimicrobiia bacterium]|nr:GMC family oxidoreductase N-terminal domain-containing protein [Acidimicrobiia bacterium]